METLPYLTNKNIVFNFIEKRPRINKIAVSKWINYVAESESKKAGEISYSFCSDEHLLAINVEHLNHDYYTDIITFDLSDNSLLIEADIYISVDRVNNNAKTLGIKKEEELLRVLVHGILHIIGYGDKTKKQVAIMREKETFYLQKYFAMFHVK